MPSLEPYRRTLDYSYAPGIFPAMEALKNAPHSVRRLLISSKAEGSLGVQKLIVLCQDAHVRIEIADKALSRLSGKENCFAAAVFQKQATPLDLNASHIVLHNISDAGNLGTVLRTALGMGFQNIAIIKPAVDVFDPHVVRASMGALFSLKVLEYNTFAEYRAQFGAHSLYPFMLQGSVELEDALPAAKPPLALIFGNEGAGLPESFKTLGTAVRIAHNDKIDSLNLSVAASIGMYAFRKAVLDNG